MKSGVRGTNSDEDERFGAFHDGRSAVGAGFTHTHTHTHTHIKPFSDTEYFTLQASSICLNDGGFTLFKHDGTLTGRDA